MSQPKWLTPTRKTNLVSLFLKSNGFCIFGEPHCQIPEHHYEVFIEALIHDWQSSDRSQVRYEWQAELKAMHNLGETRTPIRGRFNNIARDINATNQPTFYIENLGMDCLKFQPFAKVRLSNSFMRLYVQLGDSLKATSKHRKRKAIRYGKPLPQSIEALIRDKVKQAVFNYLNY